MKIVLRVFFGLVCVGAVFFAGCEERVVGTRNDWSGSQLDRVQPVAEKPDATDEFFDDTEEFLFGWTRHLTGEKKPVKRPPAVRDIPLDGRLDR